jgi:hypothetical protein
MFQSFHSLWKAVEDYSSTADRSDGGKAFRPKRAQVPGAVSTHAQAGQIKPLTIDGKSCSAVKKELIKPIRQLRPPCVPRTLRRNNDKGKIGMLRHIRQEPVSQDSGWIFPRLTKPVQKQDGWEVLVPAALHPLRKIPQVIQTKSFETRNSCRITLIRTSRSSEVPPLGGSAGAGSSGMHALCAGAAQTDKLDFPTNPCGTRWSPQETRITKPSEEPKDQRVCTRNLKVSPAPPGECSA